MSENDTLGSVNETLSRVSCRIARSGFFSSRKLAVFGVSPFSPENLVQCFHSIEAVDTIAVWE
jgi:hypothetical protein